MRDYTVISVGPWGDGGGPPPIEIVPPGTYLPTLEIFENLTYLPTSDGNFWLPAAPGGKFLLPTYLRWQFFGEILAKYMLFWLKIAVSRRKSPKKIWFTATPPPINLVTAK